MPRISEFYGIIIAMYFADHAPPHFHAIYGEYRAAIRISDLGLQARRLPMNALRLVREWAALHREELNDNWYRAGIGEPLRRIDPLS